MSQERENEGQGLITLHPQTVPPTDPEALLVDLEGFEGPLDLLLELARNRKLDITRISILALAGQYIDYIEQAKNQRLRIAADYLVMAAWLAYLKSRLLLPDPEEDDEMSGEELAAHLAFRLRRLEAMRDAVARLMARDRLGRDVFARGAPEPVEIRTQNAYLDTLYDLLKAYASERQRNTVRTITIRRRPVMSIKAARRRLERLLGYTPDWIALDMFMEEFDAHPDIRRTSLASGFSAALEMVREGGAEMRQTDTFSKIFLRNRKQDT